MTLTSKFRTAFWLKSGFSFILFMAGLTLFLYSVFMGGHFHFDIITLIGFLLIPFSLFYLFKFLFADLKTITLTEKEMIVYYLITKEKHRFLYSDLVTFDTTTTGGSVLPGMPGHTILGINLTNKRYLELRNDIYENYNELTYILFTKYKEREIQ